MLIGAIIPMAHSTDVTPGGKLSGPWVGSVLSATVFAMDIIFRIETYRFSIAA
jgi:hypothetical protein